MTHKIVSIVVGLVLLLFIGAALAFSWSVSARAPKQSGSSAAPSIPHGVTGDKVDCVGCHETAGLPASHASYTIRDCRSCHSRAGMVAIPHPVDEATADCGRCHTIAGGALPVTHRQFPDSSCTACHDTQATPRIPHAAAGLGDKCVLCHGDPSQELGMPASHLSFRVKRCTFCHVADPKQTRQPAAAGESAKKAPDIGHPVKGAFTTCVYCHRVGGQPSMPASHEAFGEDTCRFVCHFRGARAAQ